MKKPIIDFKKLINNKKFLIAASVIISIIIWFVAMIVRNPVREQAFNDVPVSVSVENTSVESLGLGIISDVSSSRFTVKISGPNYIVSSLKNTDFVLSASVDSVSAPGTYSLSVTGSKKSDISGYTFVSIEPSSIDVTFDYIDTKTYDIVPKITGISADDGLVVDTPIISNKEQKQVTIKGPRDIMKKIDSVGSLTEMSKNTVLSSSQTYDSDIVLYDENGEILYRYDSLGNAYDNLGNKSDGNLLSLSLTSIKVTQPISKKATLDVNINFTNLPSGLDKDSLNISVDHKNATVLGTPEVVDNMKSIDLAPIDFRNISLSSCGGIEVSAALPDGVKIADNIESFVVKIDLNGFAEKTFVISDAKFNGLGSGLSAKSANIKNVKICGPKEVMDELKTTDLFAEVDLGGKTAGEHTVDATIKSSKYNNIWQIGDYSSSVIISNK